jgi:hypothetical protein
VSGTIHCAPPGVEWNDTVASLFEIANRLRKIRRFLQFSQKRMDMNEKSCEPIEKVFMFIKKVF